MDEYFDRLILRSGFTPQSLAKWLRKSPRTIQRWRRTGAPLIVLRCLELRAGYDPAWKGFKFAHGTLHTPTGHSFNSFQLDQYTWFMQSQYSNGYADGMAKREQNSKRLMQTDLIVRKEQNGG